MSNPSGFSDDDKRILKEAAFKMREERISIDREIYEIEQSLREKKLKRAQLAKSVLDFETTLNNVEGMDTSCLGEHFYVIEPSGRGSGFDTRCVKCGHFENLYPVC